MTMSWWTLLPNVYYNGLCTKEPQNWLGDPYVYFSLLTRFLFHLQSLLTHVWHKGCDGLMAALLQHSDFVKGAWEVAVHCTVHDATYIITVYKVASLHWSSPRLDLVPNHSLSSHYHTSKRTSSKPKSARDWLRGSPASSLTPINSLFASSLSQGPLSSSTIFYRHSERSSIRSTFPKGTFLWSTWPNLLRCWS